MPVRPNLSNIRLELCCERTFEVIQTRSKLRKYLQIGTIPIVFLSLFVGPKDAAGRGGAMSMIYSVTQTDWEMLAKAMINLPAVERNRITQDAQLEALRHTGTKLEDFWIAIADSF